MLVQDKDLLSNASKMLQELVSDSTCDIMFAIRHHMSRDVLPEFVVLEYVFMSLCVIVLGWLSLYMACPRVSVVSRDAMVSPMAACVPCLTVCYR